MDTTPQRPTITTPCRFSAAISLLAIALSSSAAHATSPELTPASPPSPDAVEEAKPEVFRKRTFGIGAGLVFWPPSDDIVGDTVDVAPALTLQSRVVVPVAGIVGFEWTNDIVFHDWKAMGDAYGWFFGDADTDEEANAKARRVLLLWPALVFIPFGAANYTTGFGLVVWTAKTLPSMYFDGGLNLNLYLRLSDPQFRADFGFGAYGGMGLDLFKNLGMNVRFLWGTPFVHTLIRKTSGGVTTLILNINFAH